MLEHALQRHFGANSKICKTDIQSSCVIHGNMPPFIDFNPLTNGFTIVKSTVDIQLKLTPTDTEPSIYSDYESSPPHNSASGLFNGGASSRETSPTSGLLNGDASSPETSPTSSLLNGNSGSRDTSPTSRSKKKKVSFADERGGQLIDVRVVMVADHNYDDVTARSANSSCPTPAHRSYHHPVLVSQWKSTFPQPAAQYLAFRNKLESNCVSLENLIIHTGNSLVRMTGTIKVKNIAYDKQVFVRFSVDDWGSSRDVAASFQPPCDAQPLFETFVFHISIPGDSIVVEELGRKIDRVEFAVCYRVAGDEYWDNNSGANYLLVRELYSLPRNELASQSSSSVPFTSDYKPNFDEIDSLTTYRAWRHFASETYYY